jgi:hypothetical protein
MLDRGGKIINKYLKNPYIRIIVCSAVLIGIYTLEGSNDFTGSGATLIIQHLMDIQNSILSF